MDVAVVVELASGLENNIASELPKILNLEVILLLNSPNLKLSDYGFCLTCASYEERCKLA